MADPQNPTPGVPPRPTTPLPGVRHVIAVGAGKGGVGKSTVALVAALGLRRLGKRVALLDADVYGPSLPTLTGTADKQLQMDDDGRVNPPSFEDIKVTSIGHMLGPDQAVIWRGPMAQKYVAEFLERTNWGELDVLVVDLPPGTGDIPLTLAQTIPLTGAVVVCTPQKVALLDAVRALRMYQKLGVPPLGMVENMSYYLCPHCGHRDEIFDHGGAEHAAQMLETRFLGAIPLNVGIRAHGDAGEPQALMTNVEPPVRAAFEQLAQQLLETIKEQEKQGTPLPQLRVND